MSPSLHGCTVAVVGRVVLRGGSGAAMHGLWPAWTTPGRHSRWTVLLNTAWVPPLHCRRGPSRRATDLDGFWACMVCSADHSGIGYRNGRQQADPDDGTLLRTLPVLLHPTVKAVPQDGPSASMGFWPGWFVLPTTQALDDGRSVVLAAGVLEYVHEVYITFQPLRAKRAVTLPEQAVPKTRASSALFTCTHPRGRLVRARGAMVSFLQAALSCCAS